MMKRTSTRMLVFFCMMMFLSVSAQAGDPCEGLWKSISDKTGKTQGYWKIYVNDNQLFGELVRVPNQSDGKICDKCKPAYDDFPVKSDLTKVTVVGTPWIFNMKMKEAGNWKNGHIIDPSDGKIYKCKMTYHAKGDKYPEDTLEMRGEIGLGIGRSQYWKKTTQAEIDATPQK